MLSAGLPPIPCYRCVHYEYVTLMRSYPFRSDYFAGVGVPSQMEGGAEASQFEICVFFESIPERGSLKGKRKPQILVLSPSPALGVGELQEGQCSRLFHSLHGLPFKWANLQGKKRVETLNMDEAHGHSSRTCRGKAVQ